MKPITRFALERHDGPYETWPRRSRLVLDGRPDVVTSDLQGRSVTVLLAR